MERLPKPFLTTVLPETPSLHRHEGTSDTAHLLSKYREQHSGVFPASGKDSYLAIKYSYFLWKIGTYICETSMQIPCNIQFKFTFLSDTKYRKFCSALYLFNRPWLHSTEERTTTTKKSQKNTHHNFGHTCSLLQLNIGQRNNCTGTNFGVRESTWEQWPVKASLPPAQKTSYREQVERNKIRARMLNMLQTYRK